MDPKDLARIEYHRRYSRPDWRRWLRPDWERVVHPAQREAMRKDFALCDLAFETTLARRLREQDEAREREQQAALDAEHQAEIEREALKIKAEIAELRLELVWAEFCRKAGFNPSQSRVPAGNGIESGRWTGPGIGHNQGPPLRDLPKVPKEPPTKSKERTAVAKQVAKWLARGAVAVATRHPIGLATVVAATGAVWLYSQYNAHIEAYQDAPKALEDLHNAVASPRAGYDTHHIVEKTSATLDGFSKSQIDDATNLVLIPRMKHWEINGWYSTPSEDYGGLSPRDYLRGKDWDERRRAGLDAMIKFKVLKP
jgi:hypothetical protein